MKRFTEGLLPNQRLERTDARPARHGRASVAAGHSAANRWAAGTALRGVEFRRLLTYG